MFDISDRIADRSQPELNAPMARKQMVNFRAHPLLAKRFRDAMKPYYGRLGICFSAALLAFMEEDPKVQGEYLKRVYGAEIDDEVEAMLEGIKLEQVTRVRAREQGDKDRGSESSARSKSR